MRERGLKYVVPADCFHRFSRSREGAWIEIPKNPTLLLSTASRSREGAWIEIGEGVTAGMSASGRSREGAWIEI